MKLLKISFIVIVILYTTSIRSETIGLKPLDYFCEEPLPDWDSSSTKLNIYKPYEYFQYKNFVSTCFEKENILNEKNKKMQSNTKNLKGIFKFDKLAISFQINDFVSDYNFHETETINIKQDNKKQILSFATSKIPYLIFGAGIEKYTKYQDEFYGISLVPNNKINIRYRQFARKMEIIASLEKEDKFAEFNFSPKETVKELSLHILSTNYFLFEASSEISDQANHDITFNVFPNNAVTVGFNHLKRNLDFSNSININSKPSGNCNIKNEIETQNITLKYKKSLTSQILFGIKTYNINLSGTGKITDKDYLTMWERLLVGDRYYDAQYSINAFQYDIKMKNQINKSLTLDSGIQYLHLKPDGELNHWLPTPIVMIGKLDKQVSPLPYKEAKFIGLMLGVNYKINQFKISYNVNQLIPISISEIDKKETKNSNLGDLTDKLKSIISGNVQIFEVSYFF